MLQSSVSRIKDMFPLFPWFLWFNILDVLTLLSPGHWEKKFTSANDPHPQRAIHTFCSAGDAFCSAGESLKNQRRRRGSCFFFQRTDYENYLEIWILVWDLPSWTKKKKPHQSIDRTRRFTGSHCWYFRFPLEHPEKPESSFHCTRV